MKQALKNSSALTAIMLVSFVISATFLVVVQIRHDLEKASAFDPKRIGEREAWVTLERYFRDNIQCSQFLNGKNNGEAILTSADPAGPRVGMQWQQSGWIIKDIYLLKREEQVYWQMGADVKNNVVIKVTLVPKPTDNVDLTVEYLLNAPISTRLITVPVTRAHEWVYQSCSRQEAEGSCLRRGRGQEIEVSLSRSPASIEQSCPKGVSYEAHCLKYHMDAPIWRCQNN